MSALDALKIAYASESSDEEYQGFDPEDTNSDLFSRREVETLNRFQAYFNPSSTVESVGSDATEGVTDRNGSIIPVSPLVHYDSDDSYFGIEGERQKTAKKRTKKEIRKLDIAEKRRLAHQVILDDCACSKGCAELVCKDDRMDINKAFWALDLAGQKSFMRERVERSSVKRRSQHRYTDQPIKCHTYTFRLRKTGSDESSIVCRKFFLNTLGYKEHCG